MSGSPLRQTVRITNPQGFHLRPKSRFAETAARYQCAVSVVWGGNSFNGKSMWDLMLVAAEPDQEVVIEVDGPDAAEALPVLVEILSATGAE